MIVLPLRFRPCDRLTKSRTCRLYENLDNKEKGRSCVLRLGSCLKIHQKQDEILHFWSDMPELDLDFAIEFTYYLASL
jgi:hypothetical protein